MRPIAFLLSCHDAGGTVPPVLAIAEALVGDGHEVTVLSQPSVRERAEGAGCRFVPFSALGDYARRQAIEAQLDIAFPAIAGPAVGWDLLRAANDAAPDLVVVDANLSGCLAAAESLAIPSAVLLHSMYKTFVDVWFGDLWPLLEGPINEMRETFGVGPVDSWASAFAHHDVLVSVVPRAFDAPVEPAPPTMRHFGFLVPRGSPAERTATAFPAGDGPAVLVGLSTTYQSQERLLETIVDVTAARARVVVTTAGQVDRTRLTRGSNVVVAEHIPHHLLLPHADAMVTHAGLGSVAAALSFGVPLVCTPIGRDQPLNAERVETAGAGIACPVDASDDDIAAALDEVLGNPGYALQASLLAAASRAEGGPPAAAAALVALAGG